MNIRKSALDLQNSKWSVTLPGLVAIIGVVITATVTYTSLATKTEVAEANLAIGVLQRDLVAVKFQLTAIQERLDDRNFQFNRLVDLVATMSAHNATPLPMSGPADGPSTARRASDSQTVVDHILGPQRGRGTR